MKINEITNYKYFRSKSTVGASEYISHLLCRDISMLPWQKNEFSAQLNSSSVSGLHMLNASFPSGGCVLHLDTPETISAFIVGAGGQKHRRGSVWHEVAPREILVANSVALSETHFFECNAHRYIEFTLNEASAMARQLLGRDIDIKSDSIEIVRENSPNKLRISTIISAIDECLSKDESISESSYAIRLMKEAALASIVESLPIFQWNLNITPLMQVDSWQTRRAIDFIQAQHGPVTIHDVAKSLGIGVRALQSTFMRNLGISPHAYLLRVRLEAAKREILTSEAPASIAHIARHWGFLNTGKFAGEFRRVFGESPSEMRRKRSP